MITIQIIKVGRSASKLYTNFRVSIIRSARLEQKFKPIVHSTSIAYGHPRQSGPDVEKRAASRSASNLLDQATSSEVLFVTLWIGVRCEDVKIT
jgi:hypothetical protein